MRKIVVIVKHDDLDSVYLIEPGSNSGSIHTIQIYSDIGPFLKDSPNPTNVSILFNFINRFKKINK